MSDAPLRLLVISNLFPPDLAGGSAVIGDLCEALSNRGLRITVHCCYPYYPEWTDKTGRNGVRIEKSHIGNVSVRRYGLYIPANTNSLWQRLLHEASIFFSLLRSLLSIRRHDVVLVYCPAVSCVAFAVLGSLLFRKPLWLNVQDLAAEAAQATGLVGSSVISRLMRNIQAWLFNQADVWSTISPVMVTRLNTLRRKSQPLFLVPNWLNSSLKAEIEKCSPDTNRALHDPPRFLYAGNIGRKQNLLALLTRMGESSQSFTFRVHGSGAQATAVSDWIRNKDDPRFSFGPFMDEADFASALRWTDFFVITETSGSDASFMPSKLIPAIASGTPILAICDPSSPLGNEVIQHQLGPQITWDRLAEIEGTSELSAISHNAYAQWSCNALKRSMQYDRNVIVSRFVEAFDLMRNGSLPPVQATADQGQTPS